MEYEWKEIANNSEVQYTYFDPSIYKKYKIYAPELGFGEFGQVFLGESLETHEKVAIKVIHRDTYAESDFMLARQIEMQRALAPKHLAPAVFEPGIIQAGKHYFMPMELMSGCSLRSQMMENSVLPENLIKEVGLFLGEALKKLSEAKIIHRRISTEHILLNFSKDSAKVTFSLCGWEFALDTNKELEFSLNCESVFISPEVSRGESISSNSDVWTIGIVLFELITGSLPSMLDAGYLSSLNTSSPHPLPFPKDLEISEALRDLICACLHPKEALRIKPKEILSHKFLCGISPPIQPSMIIDPPKGKSMHEDFYDFIQRGGPHNHF